MLYGLLLLSLRALMLGQSAVLGTKELWKS
jgi:hypothetical protein